MKSIKFRILQVIIVMVIIVSVSCSKQGSNTTGLYVPTNADVTATATLQELQQGRALYVDNCGRCHGYYNPDNFSPSQWSTILSMMAPRAGLNASQVSLVTKYVSRGQ